MTHPSAEKKKPMARARRVSLFDRTITVGLSSAAIDLLFDHASVLSEGQQENGGFYGSTMVTFELSRVADLISDRSEEKTLRHLAELLNGDDKFKARARALGAKEALRLSSGATDAPQVHVHVRVSDSHLFVDLDIEAPASAVQGLG